MTSPTQRLEVKKQLAECRVCAWLASLEEKRRAEWAKAIADRRFSPKLVADEIMLEVVSTDGREDGARYDGPPIGESSVDTHRARGHR